MRIRGASPGAVDQERMLRAMHDFAPDADLTDRKEFNDTWYDYFSQNESFAVSVGIRDETYNRFLFKKAKGKDLMKDRQITAKEKAKTPEHYIKRTAQRTDLPGVDTRADRFHFAGSRKGKFVKARENTITWRGKKVTRLIDARGRFVSRR